MIYNNVDHHIPNIVQFDIDCYDVRNAIISSAAFSYKTAMYLL